MSKQQNSFDVVSKIDVQEVHNAVGQAMKEIHTRFDFKGSKSSITFDGKELTLISDDENKLKSVTEILKEKLIKRKVPLNGLLYGKVEQAAGNTVRQIATVQQGIPSEKAKEIIPDYLAGSMDETVLADLHAHLEKCVACRDEHQSLSGLWKKLSLLPGAQLSPAADSRFQNMLQAYSAGLTQAKRERVRGFRLIEAIRTCWPSQPAWQRTSRSTTEVAAHRQRRWTQTSLVSDRADAAGYG